MPIERSTRRISGRRLASVAESLLEASTLCAIATADASGRPHVNTAYFAWTPDWRVVWISDPGAQHSRNVEARPAVAIAVYDSGQEWGEQDRGIQLFGTAHRAEGAEAEAAATLYAKRFPAFRGTDLGAYGFYAFRPRRVKLFDEQALGTGTFVSAKVAQGRLVWERTELYRPSA